MSDWRRKLSALALLISTAVHQTLIPQPPGRLLAGACQITLCLLRNRIILKAPSLKNP